MPPINLLIKPASRNYFCSSYQDFFEYAFPRLQEVAKIIKEKR